MTKVASLRRDEARVRLLLMDTCGAEASLALVEGGEVVGEVALPGRSASERLVVALRELLLGAGWRLSGLDALAVVRGPGSFTGVRVGLSVARALAEGAEVPVIGLSRLEVLRTKGGETEEAGLAVLEAGRGEYFWEVGDGQRGIADAHFVTEYAVRAGVAVICEAGVGARLAGPRLVVVAALTAADGRELAMQRWREGTVDDALLLDALYLHKTEEEMLDRQRRHRALKQEASEGS